HHNYKYKFFKIKYLNIKRVGTTPGFARKAKIVICITIHINKMSGTRQAGAGRPGQAAGASVTGRRTARGDPGAQADCGGKGGSA
ncbi:hypothetical protein V2S84_27385, partial [Azotobacter chroococcum]|nr:hypothetical protein [Azotobacter chroococcum]